jgi:hypothetical protein
VYPGERGGMSKSNHQRSSIGEVFHGRWREHAHLGQCPGMTPGKSVSAESVPEITA